MKFDLFRLPRRCLVDSTIVTRAIGDLPPDDETPCCVAFFEAMLSDHREILIAAPTVAEIMRKDGVRPIPRVRGIEVVPFDDAAAVILGSQFPMSVFNEIEREGTTMTHLKYDALIAACASRHRAECIVSLDEDFDALAGYVNLLNHHPSKFLSPQFEMEFPESEHT